MLIALLLAWFAQDRRAAVAGRWRVRGSTLLDLALAAGSPAAVWAGR